MLRIWSAVLLISAASLCAAQTAADQNLSGMAAGILSQTNLARQAIRDRDQTAALDHVRQAQTMATQLRSELSGQPEPLLVPVKRVVETTTTYTDVKGKHGEMSADRLKKNSHVSEVEQQTSTDNLNVTSAVGNLDAARTALQKLDWTAADTALSGVTSLVHIDSSVQNVPLLQVHQNLLLARARIAEQNYRAAVAPLREAEHALADFEQQDHGTLGQQAEDMRQDIHAMADHIATDPSFEKDKLDGWITTVEKWKDNTKHPLQPPKPY